MATLHGPIHLVGLVRKVVGDHPEVERMSRVLANNSSAAHKLNTVQSAIQKMYQDFDRRSMQLKRLLKQFRQWHREYASRAFATPTTRKRTRITTLANLPRNVVTRSIAGFLSPMNRASLAQTTRTYKNASLGNKKNIIAELEKLVALGAMIAKKAHGRNWREITQLIKDNLGSFKLVKDPDMVYATFDWENENANEINREFIRDHFEPEVVGSHVKLVLWNYSGDNWNDARTTLDKLLVEVKLKKEDNDFIVIRKKDGKVEVVFANENRFPQTVKNVVVRSVRKGLNDASWNRVTKYNDLYNVI